MTLFNAKQLRPDERTLNWIVRILALCLLIQIALTFPLWFGDRSYPFLPLFDFILPIANAWVLSVLSFLFCVGLVLLLLGWQNKWVFRLFLGGAFLAAMLDVSRLQVWFYFQWILLFVLAFKSDVKKHQLLPALRFFFPFIYFWSGIHKINGYYFEETFPWFMETFDFTIAFKNTTVLILLSIILEIGIAFGLWWNKIRKMAVLTGLIFHLSILVFLGPFGQNWNEVVWPWNFAMMALLYLLYWKPIAKPVFSPFQNVKITTLPLLLLGIMPLFNSFNLWPGNLSFNMYAGNNPEGILYSPQPNVSSLSLAANNQIHCIVQDTVGPAPCFLIIDDWAFAEIKAAPFSRPTQLKKIAKKYCACLDNTQNSGLQILEVSWWKKEKPIRDISCEALLAL